MLSVLNTGTRNLLQELSRQRKEIVRLQNENTSLVGNNGRTRSICALHAQKLMRSVLLQEELFLKKFCFIAFREGRQHYLMWQKHCGSREVAWSWMWRRKVVSLWRRVTEGARRQEFQKIGDAGLQLKLVASYQVNGDLLSRISELEGTLEQTRTKVNEQQEALKEAFIRQFEESQQKHSSDSRCAELECKVLQLQKEREGLEQVARVKTGESAEHERRVVEVSVDLSRTEQLVKELTNSKCSALQFFFEKRDFPAVLLSLFRKVLELQCALRGVVNSEDVHSCSLLEREVRRVCSQGKGVVSRHQLQLYIETLKLSKVTAVMVTDVVLVTLDLSTDESCDSARFLSLLTTPPPCWSLWKTFPDRPQRVSASCTSFATRSASRDISDPSSPRSPRGTPPSPPRPRSPLSPRNFQPLWRP